MSNDEYHNVLIMKTQELCEVLRRNMLANLPTTAMVKPASSMPDQLQLKNVVAMNDRLTIQETEKVTDSESKFVTESNDAFEIQGDTLFDPSYLKDDFDFGETFQFM